MAPASKQSRARPGKVADFLDAAYDLDADDQAWLRAVTQTARVVFGWEGPSSAVIYDASDVTVFRPLAVDFIGFSPPKVDVLTQSFRYVTPTMVARTFRSLLADSIRRHALPEMTPMLELLAPECVDALVVNGLDPTGLGVLACLWTLEPIDQVTEKHDLFRFMAHHLGAAHRCRRRLHESQRGRQTLDPTEGAEAILDARKRVIHAIGPAQRKAARADIVRTAEARDLARTSKAEARAGLRKWRPLTHARWTLVDSFERGGARYIVARENQASVDGLEGLTDRERQAVAYLAVGQSTKATAYALGISDVTVRVLLGRAATKLRVRARAGLLAHPEVRLLCPDRKAPVA